MYKLYAVCAIALACSSVQAQREYPLPRDHRSERAIDNCIDDHARGERLSRNEMRRLQEQCSRRSADRRYPPPESRSLERARDLRERELMSRERGLERQGPTSVWPDGRSPRIVPDTSGAP